MHVVSACSVSSSYLAPLLLWHVVSVLPLLLFLGSSLFVVFSQVAKRAFVFQLLLLPLGEFVRREKVLIVHDLCLQVLQLLLLSLLQIIPARAFPQLWQLEMERDGRRIILMRNSKSALILTIYFAPNHKGTFFATQPDTCLPAQSTYHIVLILLCHLQPFLSFLVSLKNQPKYGTVNLQDDEVYLLGGKCTSCVVIVWFPTFLSVLSAMLRVLSLSFCRTRSANASLSSMSCNRSRSSFSHSSSSSSSFFTDCPELPLIFQEIE